ncbi:type II secretion system protein [bacterium]|nr:type II secretion system protein [bacterium]
MKNKTFWGFTLAEVLIAMAVIGVIAAITIPLIVENHKKISVATQLKKFYSNTNQALKMYKTQAGEDLSDFTLPDKSSTTVLKFYEEALAPYMIDIGHKTYDGTFIGVQYNDGSGFYAYANNTNLIHIFYCVEFRHCKPEGEGSMDGRNTFLFTIYFNKNQYKGEMITSSNSYHSMSRDRLLSLCKYGNSDDASVSSQGRRHACARLIEIDGWTIKPDYPWRQRTVPTS